MGKNFAVIQRAKEAEKLRQKIGEITPQVYAALALALHRRYGWGHKRISDLFAESQAIWNECLSDDRNMIQLCEDETGIQCVSTVNER